MRRLSYAGACVSLRTGCMVGLVRRRSVDGPGGWLTSVTPQPESTSGHLWHPAARSVDTNAPSAVVHLIMLYGRRSSV